MNALVFTPYIERLQRKEISRAQVAAELGMSVSALNSKFIRYGVSDKLKGFHQLFLDRSGQSRDSDYAEAVQFALKTNARKAFEKFPGLSYQVLCRKVKAAKGP